MIVIPLSDFGLMTVAEVAGFHGVGRHTVWRWIAEDRLPVVPIDRGYLVRRADCEKFVKPRAGAPVGNLNAIGGRIEKRRG